MQTSETRTRTSLRLLRVLLLTTLIAALAPAGAAHAAPQEQQPVSCSTLATAERPLVLELRDLPPQQGVAPILCVLSVSGEDVDKGIFIGLRGPDEFRTAKEAAVPRLVAQGVDPCLVATWEARTPTGTALTLTQEDRASSSRSSARPAC